MRRTISVLVAVVSAAALLSACGSATEPAAAKVGSETISRTTLDDELGALSTNDRWLQTLSQSWEVSLDAPEGGVSSRLAAAWLTTLIGQVIVDQAFERRDLTVTAQDREDATAALLGIFGDQENLDAVPRSVRRELEERQARYAAVAADLSDPPPPTDAQLLELFREQTPLLCQTEIAVSQIQVATRAEADEIVALLDQGADFASLVAQRSDDAQSVPSGGLIGCRGTPQFEQISEPLRLAVESVPVGGVTPPVQSDLGFHVLKVVPWDFALVRALLVQLHTSQLAPPMQQFIGEQLAKAKVWVDPRYGTIRRRGGVVVEPPVPPTVRDDPPLTSSTTAPAGATSP